MTDSGPSQSPPAGVPPRPSPLPPARSQVPLRGPEAVGPTTVVPGGGQGRPAPPRPPLQASTRPVRGRKARLTLRRVDPWSAFVMSLMLSLFLAVVTIVASLVLYAALSVLGVPDSINESVSGFRGDGDLLTKGRFVGFGALIAAANVVLLTAMATLGAMLYNVCATFMGGVEITLAERE